MMKTKITAGLIATLFLAVVVVNAASIPALAVKPAANLAAAQQVPWYVSAAVMPAPPYGSRDIPGSDTASKLIVNQPNGNTQVTITGAMNGLRPSTEYTVYISKGYTPYTGWDVAGDYVIGVEYLGIIYPENLRLTQSGTAITGVFLNLVSPPGGSNFDVIGGSVIGNTININLDQTIGSLVVHMTGTIAPDGSMSGTWADVAPGTRTGSWSTTSGIASGGYTGDLGWPGLFTISVQPFTFTTDINGAGSWHINLVDSNLPLGTYFPMSVWINEAGSTMLISDTFIVTR